MISLGKLYSCLKNHQLFARKTACSVSKSHLMRLILSYISILVHGSYTKKNILHLTAVSTCFRQDAGILQPH